MPDNLGSVGEAYIELKARVDKGSISQAAQDAKQQSQQHTSSPVDIHQRVAAQTDAEIRAMVAPIHAREPIQQLRSSIVALLEQQRTHRAQAMRTATPELGDYVAGATSRNYLPGDVSQFGRFREGAASILARERDERANDFENRQALRHRRGFSPGDMMQRLAGLYETDRGKDLRANQIEQDRLALAAQKRINYVDTEIKLGKFAASAQKANDALSKIVDPIAGTAMAFVKAGGIGTGVAGGLAASAQHFASIGNPAVATQFNYAMRDAEGAIGMMVSPYVRGFTKSLRTYADYAVTQGYTQNNGESKGSLTGTAAAAAGWFLPGLIPGVGQASIAVRGLFAIGSYFAGSAAESYMASNAKKDISQGIGGSPESGRILSGDQLSADIAARLMQNPIAAPGASQVDAMMSNTEALQVLTKQLARMEGLGMPEESLAPVRRAIKTLGPHW